MERINAAFLRRKIREKGLWEVLQRIVVELGRLVYHQRACFIFRDDVNRPLPLDPAPLLAQLADFEFRWLDLAAPCDQAIMAEMMDRSEIDYTPEDLQTRMDSRHRAFVVFHGKNVVHYHWVCFGEREIYTGQVLALEPDECYLYDGYTFNEYRGRRLVAGALYCARQDLGRDGVARRLIDVACTNTSSIRAVESAGFYRHLRITQHIVCSRWKFCRQRVLSPGQGQPSPAQPRGGAGE